MILSLLVGCAEPISNDFLTEDQEFLGSLPRRGQHEVGVEEGAAPPDETSLQRGVAEFNANIDELLGWVDDVSAYPPSERTRDGRSWGPYAGETLEWRLDIERVEIGQFQWAFSARELGGSWVAFAEGRYLAGFDPDESRGGFTFDFDALADLGEGERGGALAVEYDYIGSHELWGEAIAEGSWFRSWYREDEETASFQYRTPFNMDDTGEALEEYTVLSRWLLSGGGRSDAAAAGGDLGGGAVEVIECWDEAGDVVFQQAEWGAYLESEGEEARCPFSGPEAADPWLEG